MVDLSFLKQMGELRKLQKQLSSQEVTLEENGVTVSVGGDQEIKQLKFASQVDPNTVKNVINSAFKRLQKQVAQGLMGK